MSSGFLVLPSHFPLSYSVSSKPLGRTHTTLCSVCVWVGGAFCNNAGKTQLQFGQRQGRETWLRARPHHRALAAACCHQGERQDTLLAFKYLEQVTSEAWGRTAQPADSRRANHSL